MTCQEKKKEPYDQKTAELTPEEQEIRRENLAARAHYDAGGIKSLCSVICLQAVKDYPKMLRRLTELKDTAERMAKKRKKISLPPIRKSDEKKRGPKKKTAEERLRDRIDKLNEDVLDCEEFFDSEMFINCTGVGGKKEAIRKIRKMSPEVFMIIERRLAKG